MSGGIVVLVAAGIVLTTKGDIATFSTVRTRLGVGSDDQILVADATPAEGLAWVTNTGGYQVALSDETTDLTTGTNKSKIRAIRKGTIDDVRASVSTVATGATLLTIDINVNSATILSTKITIDASETTSESAATPPVISATALADNDEIEFDIDAVGNTTTGRGAKVQIVEHLTQ